MEFNSRRLVIKEDSTESTILVNICNEFTGSARVIRIHSFLLAMLNAFFHENLKHQMGSDSANFGTLIQAVGSAQGNYMSAFAVDAYGGLDLVRSFSGAITLGTTTRQLVECAKGFDGFDVESVCGLSEEVFKEIGSLGFDVKLI